MNQLYPNQTTDTIDPVADLLGGGRVVAYKVDLGLALGSATAGLWLSQLWFWANTADTERTNKKRFDGEWVCWSQDEITAQTALTRRESDTARRDLRSVGVLEEAKRGLPARAWYRIDKVKLYELLRAYCGKKGAANKVGGNVQTDGDDGQAPDDAVQNAQTRLAENANLDAQNRQTVQTDVPNLVGGKRQTTIGTRASENSSEINPHIKENSNRPCDDDPAAALVAFAQAASPALAVVSSNIKNLDTDDFTNELVSLVVGLRFDASDARSIVLEALKTSCGADRVRRAVAWWPTSTQAKTAENPPALFRKAVRGDWAKREANESAARAAETGQKRAAQRCVAAPVKSEKPTAKPDAAELDARKIVAPPTAPTAQVDQATLDSIMASLSPCALERLHTEAVSRATEKAAPPVAATIRATKIGEITKGGAGQLLKAARNTILRERAACPIRVNGRDYYDQTDAHAAKIDLDFG